MVVAAAIIRLSRALSDVNSYIRKAKKTIRRGKFSQKHNYEFYIHGSVHHYNCSKINTNKMTLMDYPLFHG